MKFVKYGIKGIKKSKMNKIEVKVKQVKAERNKILDAEKNKEPDTSVQISNV